MADLLGVAPTAVGDTLRLGSLLVRSAVVDESSPMIGRSMARLESGVSTIGIVRNDQLLPTNEALLEAGDIILLAGSTNEVSAAVESLESGP
jgi:K+/H+ antiporter YhaU regulatory subunit KhtT